MSKGCYYIFAHFSATCIYLFTFFFVWKFTEGSFEIENLLDNNKETSQSNERNSPQQIRLSAAGPEEGEMDNLRKYNLKSLDIYQIIHYILCNIFQVVYR